MKAVIIEDEAVAARRMKRLVDEVGLDVIAILHSNNELDAFLSSSQSADIFFMDIHLSDGIVFDVLDKHIVDTPIIFTTAFDQYAIKAFKQNSIDYLMKPIDKAELQTAIDKHKKIKFAAVDLTALKALLTPPTPTTYKERLSIKIGDKIKSFQIADTKFFYSEDKINYMVQANNRAYPIDYTIEQLFGLLNPKDFYRVNRGCIISINSIQDVIAYSNSRLKVVIEGNAQEIIVSRERVKDFKQWLG